MREPEVAIERGRPGSGAFGPLDEYDGALARHVVEPQVTRVVGRAEAVAIDVVHRPATRVVVVHEGIGGARDLRARRPTYIAFERLHSASAWALVIDALPEQADVAALLSGYRLETSIEDFTIYRRID